MPEVEPNQWAQDDELFLARIEELGKNLKKQALCINSKYKKLVRTL
jgi:hypothetical protein